VTLQSPPAQPTLRPGRPHARFSLRSHLVALVLAVLLPALAVGTGGVWLAINSYGAAFDARLKDTAGALAVALDAEIGRLRDGLAVLATSGALEPGSDPDVRDAQLRRAAAVVGAPIGLLDPAGHHLAHTATAPGQPPPPPTRSIEALRRVVETRSPVVTDLVVGVAAGRPVAAVMVPVLRDGNVTAVIAARLEPERLRALLGTQELGGEAVATLFDGRHRFVARTRAHEEALGRSAMPWFIEGITGRDRAVLSGATAIDGTHLIVGFARLRTAPGWVVSVAEPRATYARSRAEPLLTLAAAGLPLLALGAGMALWLARRLLRPVTALSAHARAIVEGTAPSQDAPPTSVTEFEALRADMAAAEAAQRQSEAQLRTIVETVPVGLVMAELPSGRIVGGNAYVEQMLRHPVLHSPDIHSYSEWVSFHADGTRVDGIEYPLARMVLAGEENPSIEVQYQRGDGTRAWTRIMGRPVRNKRGELVGGVVALLDVDAERRAREDLAEREARFSALFSSIDEGYCLAEMILDDLGRPVDYRFLEVNPLFEAMTGLSDAAGRRVLELVPGLEPHWIETYARVALGGETIRFEQGSEAMGRWFDVFAAPAQPRGRFAVVFKDVTERRWAEAALRQSEVSLRRAADAARFATFDIDHAGATVTVSDLFRELWGLAPDAPIDFAALLERVHPADRPIVERHRGQIAEYGGAFEIEFRVVLQNGSVRWLVSRGDAEPGPDGLPARVSGVNVDVTERKAAEERQALLSREVDHRAKNALAVVQAALRLTRKDDVVAYAHAVEGRVGALARAQTVLAVGRWEGADLRALLEAELALFVAGENGGQRTELEGPPVALPPSVTQPLAMAAHELATNAIKHGALSVPGGRVSVSWRVERKAGTAPLLRLRWTETGGPAVKGPPGRRGFGSRLLEGTLRGQLGGAVSLDWQPTGLVCDMEVPLARGSNTATCLDVAAPVATD